jgi:DNA-binding CsgD family transcriptional regulator
MRWFKSILPLKAGDPIPPEGMDTDQEKQWRISLLTDDEIKAFEWFRQGYTARWTAETMLLDRKTAKRLFDSIYRKLCVADEAEVSRVYRAAKLKPEELPPEENDV